MLSCKSPLSNETRVVSPGDDSLQILKNNDTSIHQEEDVPSIETVSNRVAWQKPSIILDIFGKDLIHQTIADIGAGPTGYFTFYLARRGAHVIAIDIDHGALAYIESNKAKYDTANIRLIKTRLAKPSDPMLVKEEVDGILIVNTIAFIKNKSEYLKMLHSKLKTNGKLVIVDFKMKNLPLENAPTKAQRVYDDVLETILIQSGYKNVVVNDRDLEYQYIITAEK